MDKLSLLDRVNRRVAAQLNMRWDEITPEQKEFGRGHTITLLKALRNPTDAVLKAVPGVDARTAKKIWQAMIDIILAGE